jgi:hypothetical protein
MAPGSMRVPCERVEDQNGIRIVLVQYAIGFIGDRDRPEFLPAFQNKPLGRISEPIVLGLYNPHTLIRP